MNLFTFIFSLEKIHICYIHLHLDNISVQLSYLIIYLVCYLFPPLKTTFVETHIILLGFYYYHYQAQINKRNIIFLSREYILKNRLH